MDDTNTGSGQGAGGIERQSSGVDLARVALHQARLAAKARSESDVRRPQRRVRAATVRHSGREPVGLAAVLERLMAERALDLPVAGGTVLEQWPSIAAAVDPILPVHVQAVAFHEESGQLDLCPDSSDYATQLLLIQARLVAAVNETVGATAVRVVRVLDVGSAPGQHPADAVSGSRSQISEGTVETRDMASDGFRRTLAAHLAARQAGLIGGEVDVRIAQAVERQTRAMRELSRRAFPEEEVVSDDAPALIEAAHIQQRRRTANAEAGALGRARAERAGMSPHTSTSQALGRSG